MKYCTYCNVVYSETTLECECQTKYSWKSYGEIKKLPIEAKCKTCDSSESLKYRESWMIGSYEYGNYCTCSKCQEKIDNESRRQETMKYLLIDNYQNETHLCDDNDEVEEHLKYYTENEPWDSVSTVNEEILILKLEPIEKIKADDFKPPLNTHIVIWDHEYYRVEEVIKPEMECEGDYSIRW